MKYRYLLRTPKIGVKVVYESHEKKKVILTRPCIFSEPRLFRSRVAEPCTHDFLTTADTRQGQRSNLDTTCDPQISIGLHGSALHDGSAAATLCYGCLIYGEQPFPPLSSPLVE